MTIDRPAAQAAFAAYVRPYDPQDPKIALKIAHTHRVAGLCQRIAQSAGFSAPDVDLAWLCGLLHDVGRFEQVRRWHTFNDALSADHAGLGADILFAQGRIRDFLPCPDEDALLEAAVRLHSVYRLPAELSPRTLAFCRVLRDADKIDILRANCETPLTDIYNVTEAQLRTAQVSPAVMASYAHCQATARALKRTPADSVAALTSLVFELEYPLSLRIVQQQGYLDRLLHFVSDDPVTAAQFATLRRIMATYLARREKEVSPMELVPGLTGSASAPVTPQNTAVALGSGTLPVFATPALAALMEKACWQCVAPALPAGSSTVGVSLQLTHSAPTPLGGTVVCRCTLTAVEGRTLTFSVTAHDAQGQVAQATHQRVIVQDDRFVAKAEARPR